MAMFQVVVRGIIHNGNKILIGRKRDDWVHPLQGQWHLIGGKLEHDENPWVGVVREIKEETNVDVEPVKIIDVGTSFVKWPDDSHPDEYVTFVLFECLPVGENYIKAGDDVVEAKWIEAKELGNYLKDDLKFLPEKGIKFFQKLGWKGE